MTIGREGHNDIPLPQARGVSRDHCKLWRTGHAKYSVADLGSTNGVLLNNTKVPRADVVDGDEVQVGDIVLTDSGDEIEPVYIDRRTGRPLSELRLGRRFNA